LHRITETKGPRNVISVLHCNKQTNKRKDCTVWNGPMHKSALVLPYQLILVARAPQTNVWSSTVQCFWYSSCKHICKFHRVQLLYQSNSKNNASKGSQVNSHLRLLSPGMWQLCGLVEVILIMHRNHLFSNMRTKQVPLNVSTYLPED
jgi:hypothetical protein